MFSFDELRTIAEAIDDVIETPDIELSGDYLSRLQMLQQKLRAELIPEEQWQPNLKN